MAELSSDALGPGTWEDELGGVIPKGTNLEADVCRRAGKTLAKLTLAKHGNPNKWRHRRRWANARNELRETLEECGLRMSRREAAEVLERVAIGEEGAVRATTIRRILANPDYARQVWTEAQHYLADFDHNPAEVAEVAEAARILGLVES